MRTKHTPKTILNRIFIRHIRIILGHFPRVKRSLISITENAHLTWLYFDFTCGGTALFPSSSNYKLCAQTRTDSREGNFNSLRKNGYNSNRGLKFTDHSRFLFVLCTCVSLLLPEISLVYREKLEIGIPTGFSFFRNRALKLYTHLSTHKKFSTLEKIFIQHNATSKVPCSCLQTKETRAKGNVKSTFYYLSISGVC